MLPRKIIAKTDRLYLHEMTALEAEDAFELNSDPEVIRYTGDPPFESVSAAMEFLQAYSDYERNGMGRWAVRLIQDDAFLGWCGLKRHENGEVDLGYRMHQRYWNRGFATEASGACLRLGFEHFNLDYIIGRVMPQNVASVRVLQKLGMWYWKPVICEQHPADCYRIDKAEWINSALR